MLKALRSEKEAGDLLGTYLLQGWIMTDQICSVEGCSFPLMRSKDGSLSFCTHHDTLPNSSAKGNYKPKPVVEEVKTPVVDDMQDELQIRRQRREQSSKASQLIGQKMLQRWALLNEHCPNDSCYAVPLVRNPDTKQMFCVICENIILTEEEAAEIENKKKAQEAKEQEALQLENEKKKQARKEQAKREQEKRELEAKEQLEKQVSPTEEEPKKRQKTTATENERKYQQVSDYFSSDVVVSALSTKMNELTERIKECNDPKELGALFKSVKSCAGAIQACVEAGQACDKILLQQ